jgi:hypothetical protein
MPTVWADQLKADLPFFILANQSVLGKDLNYGTQKLERI